MKKLFLFLACSIFLYNCESGTSSSQAMIKFENNVATTKNFFQAFSDKQLDNIVLATGGGSLMRESNRLNLKDAGQVVYLRASAEQLYSRIRHDKNRPLMQTKNPLQTLRDLLKAREGHYLELADLVVPTGRQRASTISRHIMQRLKKLQDRSHANTRT